MDRRKPKEDPIPYPVSITYVNENIPYLSLVCMFPFPHRAEQGRIQVVHLSGTTYKGYVGPCPVR